MDQKQINRELFGFLEESPVSFFAVRNMGKMLEEAGAVRLTEDARWELQSGKTYYVTRNGSALIAFRIPGGDLPAGTKETAPAGFSIMASHCDSPAFRIKTRPVMGADGRYVSLNVEKYGGMLCEPWFDRPLSVAGRIAVRTGDGVEMRLINIDRDLMIIPHLAIHMNRSVNDGYKIDPQKDMLPLLAMGGGKDREAGDIFLKTVAEEAGVAVEDILDTELYLYLREQPVVFGLHNEFIGGPHLDDLQCVFASLKGFLTAEPGRSIAVHCVYDNEEVGSGTKQGAASTFLSDVLHRVNEALEGTEEEYRRRLACSLLLSADNAHAVHPNHPEKSDPTNRPVPNGGIVIKYSANQKYTTDAVSGALFRRICEKAGVPVQTFHNRSDQAGGSTLGNISVTQVALNSVDIGLAQLAMHSSYETAGAEDTALLAEAARVFYGSALEVTEGGYRIHFGEGTGK